MLAIESNPKPIQVIFEIVDTLLFKKKFGYILKAYAIKGTKDEWDDEVGEHEMVDFLCLVMIIR